MVHKKIALWIIVAIILTTTVLSTTSVSIINSPPIFLNTTISETESTNINLTPYIYDPNWDPISCSYCYLGSCLSSCSISTLTIGGSYLVEVTLDDGQNFTVTNITLIIEGGSVVEPTSSSHHLALPLTPLPPAKPVEKNITGGQPTDNVNQTELPSKPIKNKPETEIPKAVDDSKKEKNNTPIISIVMIGFILVGVFILFLLTRRREEDEEEDIKVRHAPTNELHYAPTRTHRKDEESIIETGPDMSHVKNAIKKKLLAEKKKTLVLSDVKNKIKSGVKKDKDKPKFKAKAKPKTKDVKINMALVKRRINKKIKKKGKKVEEKK